MLIGRVIGSLISTVKDKALVGVKLMVVRLKADGRIVIAADASHVAGYGDLVYLAASREGAAALNKGMIPVDAGIVGIIDE